MRTDVHLDPWRWTRETCGLGGAWERAGGAGELYPCLQRPIHHEGIHCPPDVHRVLPILDDIPDGVHCYHQRVAT